MPVYYLILLLIVVLGLLLVQYKPSKTKKIIFIVVVFGVMWFINTFRNNIGYDYYNYIRIFESFKGLSFGDLVKHMTRADAIPGSPTEPGYAILTWLMGFFVTSHTVMYGIYALIITVPVAFFVYKYCDNVWVSAFLYVTMFFFFTGMNFTRQSIACSVALLGFDFFREKKTIPFLLIALLAISFQYSAFIIIPIYIATFFPVNKYTISGYTIIVFLTFIFSSQILEVVMKVVYSSYKDSIYVLHRLGGNFIVLPLVITIAICALFPAWRKRNKYADSLFITAIISCTFWLFGAFSHAILERFCMYTYIYTLYTLPSAISSLKASDDDIAKHDNLLVASQKKKLTVYDNNILSSLGDKIKDHTYYYWSGIIALLILTLIYFYSGVQIRYNTDYVYGVYGVMPYQSHIEFLHTDPPDPNVIKAEFLAQQKKLEAEQQQ